MRRQGLVGLFVLGAACGGEKHETRGGDEAACKPMIDKIDAIAKAWNADHRLAMLHEMPDGESYRAIWKLCTTRWTDEDRACIAAAPDFDRLVQCDVGIEGGRYEEATVPAVRPSDRDPGGGGDEEEGARDPGAWVCECKDLACFDMRRAELTPAQAKDPRVAACGEQLRLVDMGMAVQAQLEDLSSEIMNAEAALTTATTDAERKEADARLQRAKGERARLEQEAQRDANGEMKEIDTSNPLGGR